MCKYTRSYIYTRRYVQTRTAVYRKDEWNDENRMERGEAEGFEVTSQGISMSTNVYTLVYYWYVHLCGSSHEWRRRNMTYDKKP